jgi:hypothetical protein
MRDDDRSRISVIVGHAQSQSPYAAPLRQPRRRAVEGNAAPARRMFLDLD